LLRALKPDFVLLNKFLPLTVNLNTWNCQRHDAPMGHYHWCVVEIASSIPRQWTFAFWNAHLI